jgi:glutamate-1-semialdehyde 2,1-aminomutase
MRHVLNRADTGLAHDTAGLACEGSLRATRTNRQPSGSITLNYDVARLAMLTQRELNTYVRQRPMSATLFEQARLSMPGGVPMGWMSAWAGPFPPFAASAVDARVTDVDGHTYADFALSEGAALVGHASPALQHALAAAGQRGLAQLLPTADALWVAEELERRFGLPAWHFALSATDANRFALRLARELTGRSDLVVFHGYYHGTLDEAPGDYDPGLATESVTHPRVRVIDFNDLDGLESALAGGSVACVMCEPALTNVGIVEPDPDFHAALRAMTRRADALLIVDESHTFAAGPGGATRAFGLEPDILTIGKAIGGGAPAAAYGFSAELAAEIERRELLYTPGVGGTLAGSAFSLAMMRATLEHVLHADGFARAHAQAALLVNALRDVVADAELDWRVAQLGCRINYAFTSEPPRNHRDAQLGMDHVLSQFLRVFELNRGVLLTPFLGNTALVSPVTRAEDIVTCATVLRDALGELLDV